MFINIPPALAQIPTITYTQGKYETQAPDWSKITWNTLPPVQQPGYLKIPQKYISIFGYDPSRQWSAGQKVDSVVMLGDADDAFKMSNFTLKSIDKIASLPKNLTLKDIGLMQWQTPASLVKAIPSLGNLSVTKVPVLAPLLSRGSSLSDGKISQLLRSNPQGANTPLGKLDLSKYSINSVPGLDSTRLGKFKSWQQSYVNQVPGLNQVPFDKMPQPINSGLGVVGIASVVLGTSERGDPNVGNNYFVSGSVVRGDRFVPVACPAGKECSYLEMGDFAGSQGALYGKRWASGSSQQVKGGYGFLAAVNNGKEPTGLLVYGNAFKVILTGVDESKGTADFGLNFRICVRPPFMPKTCTPYFIGPVPWIPVNENGLVIVGVAAK
ncbi:hypothetical protein [aff. Roholtiella sp. LEGE 12411]|uniref:hypothetical protein n=1 Tax=aff. Roholtiella sp. LEGE 12411 TaxID=1828822 RepID=UPI00187EF253|nr:hypothetical protein [aff. Roholtiella sp. LEGE 12411]MBE9035196.1 hypothetical protein [aff. Roholtiella sp. LEGE 12411]